MPFNIYLCLEAAPDVGVQWIAKLIHIVKFLEEEKNVSL